MKYYDPIVYIVPEEEHGWKLKTILMSKMSISRSLLGKLKQTELGITVNGTRQYISVYVNSGDRIEVRMTQERSDDILAQPMDIDVLYEDDHILVVNKVAGMIVHPTSGHYINTLANGVVHYWAQADRHHRFRPIQRLDQETSGIIVIAKNPYVHHLLSAQLQASKIDRHYVALVNGYVVENKGTIDVPIDRDSEQPHIRVVTHSGYRAVTHYEVIRRFDHIEMGPLTYVGLQLETGRTHQIRVHMKHLGHTLVGDRLYGDVDRCVTVQRHALHAIKLRLTHPMTKQWMTFEAPLPSDILNIISET